MFDLSLYSVVSSCYFQLLSASPGLGLHIGWLGASLVAQSLKNLPTMQEDPLEKEIATHSSMLTWKIPWTEDPGPWDCQGSDTT